MSIPGPGGMFSIGEFSRVTGITVKALRFYHEQRLLIPTQVDRDSGYRYYHQSLIEPARTIAFLRSLEFSIEQIRDMLRDDAGAPHAGMLDGIERHKAAIEGRIRELRGVVRSLNQFIAQERQFVAMAPITSDADGVREKTLDAMLIAGIRMKGKYSDCGKGFGRIGRAFGRYLAGPPLLLHYDTEYKEEDADFEACFPVRQAKEVEGICVRELPGGRCVSLIHVGPYEQLGASYAKILKYAKEKGYAIESPTREVYLKGPGMIFRGNPKKYVTEIQLPITGQIVSGAASLASAEE